MAIMEQPLTIVFVGLLISGGLLGGLIQTGKKQFLYAAIGSVLLTLGLLAIERTTITPREAVRATLFVIASDLERNDVEAVVRHISDGRTDIQDDARKRMAQVEIVDVDIKRNLKVDLTSARGMNIAEATFNCVFRVRPTESRLQGFIDAKKPIPKYFKVRFKEENGAWRIRDYEMNDPRAGIGT